MKLVGPVRANDGPEEEPTEHLPFTSVEPATAGFVLMCADLIISTTSVSDVLSMIGLLHG